MPAFFRSFAPVVACLSILAFSDVGTAEPAPEIKALMAQLQDKDEGVRLKAAKELGKLKDKAKDAIPALIQASKDEDEDVRVVAKKSLAAIREAIGNQEAEKIKEALEPIIKELKKDAKDNKAKLAAIEQLADLGPNAKEAGAALVEFGVMSLSPKVSEAALAAFEKIDPLVQREVFIVMIDEEVFNKGRAIGELQKMGTKAKAALPLVKRYYDFQIRNPRLSRGTHFEQTALNALVSIGPDDAFVQQIVLNKVAAGEGKFDLMHDLKIDNKQKYAAISAGVSKTYDRVAYINQLGKLGADSKAALPALMRLKFDGDADVRQAAVTAIDAIKD